AQNPAPQTVSDRSAQPTTVADQDLELLRKDIRSTRKQIVAANIQLTDTEAEKFWPLYDQYAAETIKIYDARYAIVKEYAANLRTLTDAQAMKKANGWAETDEAMTQLRRKYLPLFEKIVQGKKAALFFQLDRRLALMIDLQLASEIPLVQP
ncbi:MAG TPA: hypothetical protein VEV81_15495, partial [Pyrinomonadaceae bacterium]|nr:hypothetical protein [Pyrinomonadaceae bacterium]